MTTNSYHSILNLRAAVTPTHCSLENTLQTPQVFFPIASDIAPPKQSFQMSWRLLLKQTSKVQGNNTNLNEKRKLKTWLIVIAITANWKTTQVLITWLIIKITISSIVIGLKNSYFPLIHLPCCYRTLCNRTACYPTVCYRTVQQTNHIKSCSLNQPITTLVSITIETVYKLINLYILLSVRQEKRNFLSSGWKNDKQVCLCSALI